MFLLILGCDLRIHLGIPFTFQYVSINTIYRPVSGSDPNGFTFQYVSINTFVQHCQIIIKTVFTFQYVSINTSTVRPEYSRMRYLHSNMFLLILLFSIWTPSAWDVFTFQYVSINTFAEKEDYTSVLIFTFQYVSINTLKLTTELTK